MNTGSTSTSADSTVGGRDKSKKYERKKDIVYKGDRVDVWATGNNPRVAAGTYKSMHPILADKLVAKGNYSFSEILPEGEKKSKKKKGTEE
jgi:hypothetical protein